MAVSLSDPPPSQGPTCPVCFRDYSDSEPNLIPRILQCGHTYCTECLERLLSMEPEEDEFRQVILHIRQTGTGWATDRRYPLSIPPQRPSNELKCPTCNGINRIHNRDIGGLTKNFALLSCRPQNDPRIKRKTRVQHYCAEHDHDKRIYCNDCKALVCAYCQLYGEHRGHDCTIGTEVGKAAVQTLLAAKASVSADLEEVTQAEERVMAAISQLQRRERRATGRVTDHFASLVAELEERKRFLLGELKRWSNEQHFILQAQLDALQGAKEDCKMTLSDCCELTEGDPLDALSQQEDTVQGVDTLHSRVLGLSFHPLINPSIRCRLSGDMDDLMSGLIHGCQVVYDAAAEGEAKAEDGSTSEEDEDGTTEGGATRNGASSPLTSATANVASHDASSFSVQDTQDPATALDFTSGLPKLEPASSYSGAANNWYGVNPRAPQQPMRMPLGLRHRLNHPSSAGVDEEALRPTQAMNTDNTMYFNPIAPKPKLTNLYSPLQLPRPSLPSSSDSEDEAPHLPHHVYSRYLSSLYTSGASPFGATLDHPLPSGPSAVESSEAARERYGEIAADNDDEGVGREVVRSTMAGTISSLITAHIDSDSISSADPPSSGDEDELVIPPSRQYSWTTDASNGRSLMLEIDHHGTSVQLSIQTQQTAAEGSERGADLTNLDMDLEEDYDLDP